MPSPINNKPDRLRFRPPANKLRAKNKSPSRTESLVPEGLSAISPQFIRGWIIEVTTFLEVT